MSKKLVNSPTEVVNESLTGFVKIHPGLTLLEGHRVVIRSDIDKVIKEGKVAGALADIGRSLQEITSLANEVAANIGTMSVSLSPCCVPGQMPSFSLADDEMELGLGIHGEAGTETIKLLPADEVVAKMLDHLTSNKPEYNYFVVKGTEMVLIVNNLGGTSDLELSIVAGSALKYIKETLHFNVVRTYMGRFMTSLEMAGVSLTLMNVDTNILKLLDYPTSAPSWPNSVNS